MKRFLYGRLYSRDDDYDFYIPTTVKIGLLSNAISVERYNEMVPLLFLQNKDGVVSFGVKDNLGLKDFEGRRRYNFMGYQLEPGDSLQAIPHFDALIEKLPDIRAEAIECHKLLDQDSRAGETMRNTALSFGQATYRQGTPWDEAVRNIQKQPNRSVILVFDASGNPINCDYAYENDTRPDHRNPARTGPEETGAGRRPPATPSSAGIRSTVVADPRELKTVTLLPPPPRRRKRLSSFFSDVWDKATSYIGQKQPIQSTALPQKRDPDGHSAPDVEPQ